jgi:hypothetical protein
MVEWFRRFAAVPGVGYEGNPRGSRTRLARQDEVPEVHVSTVEGKPEESLWWGGWTSASPAQEWASRIEEDESSEAILQRLYEALELPGEAKDYHFAIQGSHSALWERYAEQRWRRTKDELWVLPVIERLCWLDIRLIEARPEIVTDERDGERIYYGVGAFNRLIDLYAAEGFIREALGVAERAARFGQGGLELEHLRQRLARLEAEDAI